MGSPLSTTEIRAALVPAVQRGAERGWHLESLDWARLEPDRLSEMDRSAIRFVTCIEDHLPGYLDWMLTAFPTTGRDQDIAVFRANREYFRFLVAWAYDEERHAAALTRYQLAAGIAEDEEDLLSDLAQEGAKSFSLPYDHPLRVFTYALIQEKATQLFYQRFLAGVREPVLRDLLRLMARDEARHFAAYSKLVASYLARSKAEAAPHLKEVVATFRMPLATTLTGYRRWSFELADSFGYDHTEAYAALGRIVAEFVAHPGQAGADEMMGLLDSLGRLP